MIWLARCGKFERPLSRDCDELPKGGKGPPEVFASGG